MCEHDYILSAIMSVRSSKVLTYKACPQCGLMNLHERNK